MERTIHSNQYWVAVAPQGVHDPAPVSHRHPPTWRAPGTAGMQKGPAGWQGPVVRGAPGQLAALTDTVRLFRAPLTANCTVPSTSENRVWSLPMPTFTPG